MSTATTTFFVKLTNVKLFLGKKSYDYSATVFCGISETEGRKNQLVSLSTRATTPFPVKAKTEGTSIRIADSQLSFPNRATSSTTTLEIHFSLHNSKGTSGETKDYHKTQEISVPSSNNNDQKYNLVFGEIGHIEFSTVVKTREQLALEYKPLFALVEKGELRDERLKIFQKEFAERQAVLVSVEQNFRNAVINKMEQVERNVIIHNEQHEDDDEDDDEAENNSNNNDNNNEEFLEEREPSSNFSPLPPQPQKVKKLKITSHSTVIDVNEFCKENGIADDITQTLLSRNVSGEIFLVSPNFVSEFLMKNQNLDSKNKSAVLGFSRAKLQNLIMLRNEAILDQKKSKTSANHLGGRAKPTSSFLTQKNNSAFAPSHSRASLHNLDDEQIEADERNFFKTEQHDADDHHHPHTSNNSILLLQKHEIEAFVNSKLPQTAEMNGNTNAEIVEQVLYHRFCFGSTSSSNKLVSHYTKFLCREVISSRISSASRPQKKNNSSPSVSINTFSPAFFFLSSLAEELNKIEAQIDYQTLVKLESRILSSLGSHLGSNNGKSKTNVTERNKKFLFRKILEETGAFAFEMRIAASSSAAAEFSSSSPSSSLSLSFELPLDEDLPFWVIIMKEMGIILSNNDEHDNEQDETPYRFKFQNTATLDFLAALYVAFNPVELLPLLHFEQNGQAASSIWLFLCQIVVLLERQQQHDEKEINLDVDKKSKSFSAFFQQKVVSELDSHHQEQQDISLSLFAGHVAGRASMLYKSLPESERHIKTRKQIMVASQEKCGIPLLVQIANALPENILMDALLEKHGGILVHNTPHQFVWMTEWCGYFGAVGVLKWFDKETRFKGDVFLTPALSSLHRHEQKGNKNCKYALCRALQRQSIVSNGQECVEFLNRFLTNDDDEDGGDEDEEKLSAVAPSFGVFDAIDADSTVGLQQMLMVPSNNINVNNNQNQNNTSYHLDDQILWKLVHASLERYQHNPNLFMYLCISQEFSKEQLSKIDLLHKPEKIMPETLLIAIAIQLCLVNDDNNHHPHHSKKVAKIWNFEKKQFELVDVRKELEKKNSSLLQLITKSENSTPFFALTHDLLKTFVISVIPNLGVSASSSNLHQVKCCRKALKVKVLDLSSAKPSSTTKTNKTNIRSTSTFITSTTIENDHLQSLTAFTHIEELNLSNNKTITHFRVGAKLPTLTKLILDGCNLGDGSLASLPEELPNLQELSLCNNEHITGTFLSTFASSAVFSNVKKLNLAECTLMGDSLSLFLVAKFPNLEELNLKGNPFLSEIVIVEVAENLMMLKRLGVDKLSDKSKEKLKRRRTSNNNNNLELEYI